MDLESIHVLFLATPLNTTESVSKGRCAGRQPVCCYLSAVVYT